MTTEYALVPIKENSIISTLEITRQQFDEIATDEEICVIINKWLDINNVRARIKIDAGDFALYANDSNIKLVVEFGDNVVKFTLVNIRPTFDIVRVDRVFYLN